MLGVTKACSYHASESEEVTPGWDSEWLTRLPLPNGLLASFQAYEHFSQTPDCMIRASLSQVSVSSSTQPQLGSVNMPPIPSIGTPATYYTVPSVPSNTRDSKHAVCRVEA